MALVNMVCDTVRIVYSVAVFLFFLALFRCMLQQVYVVFFTSFSSKDDLLIWIWISTLQIHCVRCSLFLSSNLLLYQTNFVCRWNSMTNKVCVQFCILLNAFTPNEKLSANKIQSVLFTLQFHWVDDEMTTVLSVDVTDSFTNCVIKLFK